MTDLHLFTRISNLLYVGLATNLLLAVSSLPLLVVVIGLDPTQALVPLAIATVIATPGLPAVFEVFRRYSDEGSVEVVRTFLRAWLHHLRRSLQVGLLAVIAAAVFAVDIVWVWRQPFGAIAVPLLGIGVGLTAAITLGCLVAVVDRPDASLRILAKAAGYLMLRRWYLTAVSTVAAAALCAVVAQRPALGIGIAAAPLLYLMWANTRHALTPILGKA